ncbi:Gfo/Idh/MocA family protein [Paenibacillus sp. NPDC058071]|uniref:Gfo/Idh/MocA family protein n=1 Tax=Paenibacillus sp. NPDC058071 TaxID=3346326 RepID=UPI0036DB17E0
MEIKRKVRVGMIGYKFMGKAHSHAYRDLPFFFDGAVEPVLQTIVGRDEHSVRLAADKLGWLSYETDWRRLLERDDIDVVDIGTPNESHAEIAIAAAKAGKHVLCEKPLAMSAEEAKRMWTAADKAGIVHMICHNYRFVPAIQYAKRLITEGLLGDIHHFRAQYLQDWVSDPAYPHVWRLRKEHSGSGALGDLMSHSIDLGRYLVGEISEVSGRLDTFVRYRPSGSEQDGSGTSGNEMLEVNVDDAASALIRFENGAAGVLEATRFAKGNRNGNRIEINGSKGSLRWEMDRMNTLELYLENDPLGMQGFRSIDCTEDCHPYTAAYWPAGHPIGYEHSFIHLIHEFMKGVSTKVSPSPNFEDGYRNQVVLDGIAQSAETGATVKLTY